jgi:hypothetical protein
MPSVISISLESSHSISCARVRPNSNDTARIVRVRPAKLTAERWQIGQPQENGPRLPDGCDCPQLRSSLRNVLEIAGVVASADVDPRSALDGVPRKSPPLWRPFCNRGGRCPIHVSSPARNGSGTNTCEL